MVWRYSRSRQSGTAVEIERKIKSCLVCSTRSRNLCVILVGSRTVSDFRLSSHQSTSSHKRNVTICNQSTTIHSSYIVFPPHGLYFWTPQPPYLGTSTWLSYKEIVFTTKNHGLSALHPRESHLSTGTDVSIRDVANHFLNLLVYTGTSHSIDARGIELD